MSKRVMIDQIAFDEAVDKICLVMMQLDDSRHEDEALTRMHVEGILSIASCLRLELFNTDKSLTTKSV